MERSEEELERFRRQWQEEVQSKSRRKSTLATAQIPQSDGSSEASAAKPKKRSGAPPPSSSWQPPDHRWGDVEPRAYHDLDEKSSGRRLDDDDGEKSKEPESALEFYEKAVERERQGNLGDSVMLYRKAFRLDDKVHETYKTKYFPPGSHASIARPQNPNPANKSRAVTVPSSTHHSLQGLSSHTSSPLSEFSSLNISGEPAPTDLSPAPPCPMAELPEELLIDMLLQTALVDLASFARLAQVCKRLAYLVLTEDRIWKRVACGHEYGFAAMRYRFACTILGKAQGADDDDDGGRTRGRSSSSCAQDTPETPTLPLTPAYPSYRQMFRSRPRIRFNGCYISTVNYARPGGQLPTTSTWTSPVLIVTYYRYLRFYRDGSLVSLLTTAEPSEVVPHLNRDNLHRDGYPAALPGACMKDALSGRWRLSGPDAAFRRAVLKRRRALLLGDGTEMPPADDGGDDDGTDDEREGELHAETEGVVAKYTYRMHFAFGSAGRGARNNKLGWKGYWSYNRLTDDWAEFGLKNDGPFYWSRVKSYGNGL